LVPPRAVARRSRSRRRRRRRRCPLRAPRRQPVKTTVVARSAAASLKIMHTRARGSTAMGHGHYLLSITPTYVHNAYNINSNNGAYHYYYYYCHYDRRVCRRLYNNVTGAAASVVRRDNTYAIIILNGDSLSAFCTRALLRRLRRCAGVAGTCGSHGYGA